MVAGILFPKPKFKMKKLFKLIKYYLGFPTVAKCKEGNGSYFSFYPDDTRDYQKVEILE